MFSLQPAFKRRVAPCPLTPSAFRSGVFQTPVKWFSEGAALQTWLTDQRWEGVRLGLASWRTSLVKCGAPFGRWRHLSWRVAWWQVLRFGVVGTGRAQETPILHASGVTVKVRKKNLLFSSMFPHFTASSWAFCLILLCPQHPCVERDSRVTGAHCCGTKLESVVVWCILPSCSHMLCTLAKCLHWFIQLCGRGCALGPAPGTGCQLRAWWTGYVTCLTFISHYPLVPSLKKQQTNLSNLQSYVTCFFLPFDFPQLHFLEKSGDAQVQRTILNPLSYTSTYLNVLPVSIRCLRLMLVRQKL